MLEDEAGDQDFKGSVGCTERSFAQGREDATNQITEIFYRRSSVRLTDSHEKLWQLDHKDEDIFTKIKGGTTQPGILI